MSNLFEELKVGDRVKSKLTGRIYKIIKTNQDRRGEKNHVFSCIAGGFSGELFYFSKYYTNSQLFPLRKPKSTNKYNWEDLLV